jgi:4-amino-4-deoxy-L-arabinose transferase-like glycosyltransferase
LWVALLLGASVVWPMSYGLDEPAHIDMAYDYSAQPFHFYGPGKLPTTLANVGMQHSVPGYPPTRRLAVVPIPPRDQRPSFAQLGGHRFEQGGQPNQMVQHPPLYYWLEAVVLRLPGVSHLAWDLQVWLMRLLSVALMSPLPALCWATTKRLMDASGNFLYSTTSKLATVAAVVPLTVPNLIRDGSSVDNDTLLILTVSVIVYLLSRVLTGDLSNRIAIWLGVSLAAALWTKGLALALPPLVLVAYLVAGSTIGDNWKARWHAVWRPVAIVAGGGVVGGLWWLRNLIDYGTVQINGFGPGFLRTVYGPQDNHGTFLRFLPEFTTDFVGRIWGEIGIPDSPSPGPFVIYGWFFVVLIGFVAALLVREQHRARLRAALLAAMPVLVIGVVAGGSFATFRHWSHGTHASQGRYIYPTIVVIAALATIGWLRILQPRIGAVLLPIGVVGALLTNAAAWLLILRSWYEPTSGGSGLSGLHAAFASLLRWSPIPSAMTVWFVVVLPVLAGVICMIAVSRDARQLRRGDVEMALSDIAVGP